MAISKAEIERIRASLAAEPFTRESVVGTAEERSYSAGLARGYAMAGQETEAIAPVAPVATGIGAGVGVLIGDPVQTIGMETSTNGIADGVTELGDELTMEGGVAAPAAIPAAFPLVAGLAVLSVAALRRLLITFGPKILKVMIGAAAFKELIDILTGKTFGTDDTMIPVKPGERKKRRYSIGSNPRVRTLQKVSRHCQRLLKRHEKVIREFLPRRTALPAKALARTYLSTAERQALKG